MKPLSELQQLFCDALRSPDSPPQALLDEIPDDGLRIERFNVYRNNFIVLNGDALADMYPVIKRLAGDEAFRMLATAYVRAFPPMDRTLLLYGEAFPSFLNGIPELSDAPYLADVARIEYAWTAAYHAEDATKLDEVQMANIPAETLGDLRLRPHPSIHFISSDYPVYRIWATNQGAPLDDVISLDEGTSHIVVIRPQREVEVREVGFGELRFLESLSDNETIGTAYGHGVEAEPDFNLNSFFAAHLFDGTFCAIEQ